jgi:hypothetical protein
MSERYFLDTNALLNAVFVEKSWSRKVVSLGRRDGAVFVMGDRTLAETADVLGRIVAAVGGTADLMPVVEHFLTNNAFDRRAGTLPATTFEVTKKDQHVVEESTAAGACLVTTDAPLLRACSRGEIPSLSLLDTVIRFEGSRTQNTWYGVLPRYDKGSVYCQATPFGPSNPQSGLKQTLFHASDWLWLYYDHAIESWCAEFPQIGKLSLPCTHKAFDEIAVLVSWKAGENIILRATGTDRTATLRLNAAPWRRLQSQIRLGLTVDELHAWGCPIRVCIMDDRTLTSDAWKSLKSPEARIYPDPFDRDRLRACIQERLKTVSP